MKQLSFFLCALILIIGVEAQSLKSQIQEKLALDNSYQDLSVDNVEPQVFNELEFTSFDIAIPFGTAKSVLKRTVLVKLRKGEKTFDDKIFNNFSLLNGDLIKGKVQNVVQQGNAILFLTFEDFGFEYSYREVYRVYYLDNKSAASEVIFEAIGFTNKKCLPENKDIAYTLTIDGGVIVLDESVQSFSYIECQPKVNESSSSYSFDFASKKFRKKARVQKVVINRKIALAGSTWEQKSHFVSGITQRGSGIFEFDTEGRILLWSRNHDSNSMSSEVIGSYDLSNNKATFNYRFNGQGIEYTGNIFHNDTLLIQDGMGFGEKRIWSRSLSCRRAVFNASLQVVRELIDLGWKPDITHFKNVLFADRLDLIELFMENGFNATQFLQMKVADTLVTGTPLHLAVVSKKADALKVMVNQGADLFAKTYQGKTIFDYAEIPGNARIKNFLSQYQSDNLSSQFPAENHRLLSFWVRKSKGLSQDEGHINVSWYRVDADILFYNVYTSICERATNCEKEHLVFYYKKDKNGHWIQHESRADFPDRVKGKCDTIFNMSNRKFMIYEAKSYIKQQEKIRTEYGLRLYDETSGRFVKTNLAFTEIKSMYNCNTQETAYSISPYKSEENKIRVDRLVKDLTDCKTTATNDYSKVYYWSDRQSKFIETIE